MMRVGAGGAKGIGYACAACLGHEGAQVVIADVDETAAQQAAQRLQLEGVAASAFRCDVGQKDEVRPPPSLPALSKVLLPGSAGCAGCGCGLAGHVSLSSSLKDCGLCSWQNQPTQPRDAVGRISVHHLGRCR